MAKPRDLRHARWSLERCHFLVLKLHLWKKSSDSKGPSDCGPLGGMGRRPLSEANAVELEFKEIALDSKSKPDCAPCGGLRRRAVSEANAVELELELELKKINFEFKS